jgi:hypothetical protein
VRKSESGENDENFAANDHMLLAPWDHESTPYIKLAEDPRLLWWRTVHEYSKLDFSFEKDKLPGIGGLAQRMEMLRGGDQYLAGLWKKTLLQDLMWSSVRGTKPGRPKVVSKKFSFPSLRFYHSKVFGTFSVRPSR